MSNENHTPPASAPQTKSGRSAPNDAGEADWAEHKARRKAARKAEKKPFSRPVALIVSAVAVCVSIAVASGVVGIVENGNQLPQALTLAQINAQSDVTRSQVILGIEDGETATLVWSSNIDTAVLMVEGLPTLDGSTYQVWYDTADGPVAVGELAVRHDGAEVWATLTGDVRAATSVFVTMESGDAQTPSERIVTEIRL